MRQNQERSLVRAALCLSFGFTVLQLLGCEEVDDQTKTPASAFYVVNPTPEGKDFAANNKRHKVIVAVIDSGTDYNHPRLRANMHYELDSSGKPVGLGFDFVANDKWPSPYIARTADVDPDAPDFVRERAATGRANAESAQKSLPNLAKYLEPERRMEQEGESAFHGTHVSGLMVYDDPTIGLLAYRVLPMNRVFKGSSQNQTDEAYGNIESAIKMAIAAGARVINMSLSMGMRVRGDTARVQQAAADQKKRMARLEKLAKANPKVVFVAAAGNDGAWVGGESALQLPCGVAAANVLCVGALDTKSNLAEFSNISLAESPFIAAPGVEILSTSPSKLCPTKAFKDFDRAQEGRDLARLLDEVADDCLEYKGFQVASGTSMASPIVARMIAKIFAAQPQLSATEALQKLFAASDTTKIGPLTLKRLHVERPSWYPTKNGEGRLLNPISFFESDVEAELTGNANHGYFNFYFPQSESK